MGDASRDPILVGKSRRLGLATRAHRQIYYTRSDSEIVDRIPQMVFRPSEKEASENEIDAALYLVALLLSGNTTRAAASALPRMSRPLHRRGRAIAYPFPSGGAR